MRNLNSPLMKGAYVAAVTTFCTFLGCWAVLAHQESAQKPAHAATSSAAVSGTQPRRAGPKTFPSRTPFLRGQSYAAFQLPVSLMFAVATATSGFALVTALALDVGGSTARSSTWASCTDFGRRLSCRWCSLVKFCMSRSLWVASRLLPL